MEDKYEFIKYRVEERIARITLNVPEKRNALSLAMRDEIVSALRKAERDDEVSVVLIDGEGPSFCSGYDLTPDPSRPHQKEGWVASQHFDSWTDPFARSCLRDWLVIWDLLKPVAAKIHGYCLAGGTEIMSMVDLAFVADNAQIGYPPMRGMTTPDTLYFPWKMTMSRAKYLQLTGNSISGKEAAQMGWVAKSFPEDELEEQVMRELRPLSQVAPDLLAANKQSVNQAYEIMGFRTALAAGWQWHALTSSLRPGARQFGEIARRDGLKAAIEWRDGPFRREGL
ncbi:MAG: enoyl-CoA hydratase-related protein [Myxococcota bacterium]